MLCLTEGLMVKILLGAKCLSHIGTLRNGQVVQRIFGWKRGMASQITLSRLLRKFDQELNESIFPSINRFWFDQIKMDKLTIDFDSPVLIRHSLQEGVEVGYNPKKPGRGSHYPLMPFVAELKMAANAYRPESTHPMEGSFCNQ